MHVCLAFLFILAADAFGQFKSRITNTGRNIKSQSDFMCKCYMNQLNDVGKINNEDTNDIMINSMGTLPQINNSITKQGLLRNIIATLSILPIATLSSRSIADDSSSQGIDVQRESFSVQVPAGWTILPRKIPSISFSKYLSEEGLLVASNFNEGASLSVTRSYAQRLLKDFNIDWWFDSINSIDDVGDADLISRLLILQRQANFDGKNPSASTLLTSKKVDNFVYFMFTTPLVEGVDRKTTAKVFYEGGFLYVLWISALESVFDNDYSHILTGIQESFSLAKS